MHKTKYVKELNLQGTKVLVYGNPSDLFKDAAKELFKTLKRKPAANIGLATGATFIPFYKLVSSRYKSEGASFRKASTFNLDEYVGLEKDSKESYHTYMRTNLFSKIDINSRNSHVPDGSSKDPEMEATDYERKISRHGGIDIQYLGIGMNGHIGFNEPKTPFSSKTHVVTLSRATIRQNSRYFGKGKMPRLAITVGIGTILKSRKIIVIATGNSKARIVKKILTGRPNKLIPASALIGSRNVTFMLDKNSAALII